MKKEVSYWRQQNWCFATYELLLHYGLQKYWTDELIPSNWDQIVFKAVHAKQESEWFNRVKSKSKSKLRTYCLLKSSLCPEKYLLQSDGEPSAYELFKLRSGSNVLRIETGRYVRLRGEDGSYLRDEKGHILNLPQDQRTCLLCMKGVENESHFLLECPAFKCERQECFDELSKALWDNHHFDFNLMNDRQRVQIILMGLSFQDFYETVSPIVKKFIGRIYAKRLRLNKLL